MISPDRERHVVSYTACRPVPSVICAYDKLDLPNRTNHQIFNLAASSRFLFVAQNAHRLCRFRPDQAGEACRMHP